jgi:gliding motility-associated-like protein
VWFTKNKGQWDSPILYRGKFKGGNVFLEGNAFTYVFYPKDGLNSVHHQLNKPDGFDSSLTFHAVKMEFTGANANAQKLELDSNHFYENYFIGKDASHWATQVKSYKEVWYQDVYPGIDLKALSDKNDFRFDLVLNPGAKLSDIAITFKGQTHLKLERGNLVIGTEVGDVSLSAPYAYQMIEQKKKTVKCHYVLEEGSVTFRLDEAYDKHYPLVIDPTLVFATYTGSQSDNFGMTATYDVQGNAYTAGVCYGIHYPTTTGAFQVSFHGPTSIFNPGTDISISKFSPTGSGLIYSTYLGGSGHEGPESIVVDNANCLVVLGRSNSLNFPIVAGSFQTTNAGLYDLIITRFNTTGTALIASTYMGGSRNDGVNNSGGVALSGLGHNYSDDLRGGVVVDAANNIYIGVNTLSSNFPVTPGCLQSTINGTQNACVAKFDPNLTSPMYSTYLGGSVRDGIYHLALNSLNQLYVTGGTESPDFPTTPGSLHPNPPGGVDGFISLLSANGNNLLASSYLGTSAYDQSFFVQIDRQNKVYVFGQTSGPYPVSAGVYANPNSGQFVHCMGANLSTTFFSTVLGSGRGVTDIVPSAFLVDVCGSIYLSGWGGRLSGGNDPNSTTFGLPVSANAFSSTTDGNDFYFMVLDKDALSLQYATFFGGNISAEHVDGGTSRFDKAGIIYQAICEGCGGNSDMPVTPNVWSPQNGSSNCNNAVVKFAFHPNSVTAQIATDPINLSGCAPLSVTFVNTSTNGVSYFWEFGDGASSTSVQPAHTYTNSGTYQVRLVSVNPATCNMFDTTYVTVNVLPPFVLPPLPAVNVCLNDSAAIPLNAPAGSTFTWSPNSHINNLFVQQPKVSPLLDTRYKVEVLSTDGCKAYDSVQVFVIRNTIKIEVDSSHMCLTDTVKLNANHAANHYEWSSGQSTSSINVLSHGWYHLTTVDAYGCKAEDSVKIEPFYRIPLDSYQLVMCRYQQLQLLAPEGNYVYDWTPLQKLSPANVFNPVVSPDVSTTYSLVLYNGPCKSEASYAVTVRPVPTLTVTPKMTEILPGESVALTSLSDTISTWYPNTNLYCSVCNQTIAAPDSNTMYYAIVTNKYGCRKMDSVTVHVTPGIYVPNCFTPNGDLVNDLFKPVFSGYVEIELMIFDRWGEMVFRTTELNGGWNGKKKEANCELGVYTYKLIATDYKKSSIEKIGHVTLLR